MTRHKHADVIHAFAEGAEVQFRRSAGERWVDERNPSFYASNEYRIKPRTVKHEGWVNIYRYRSCALPVTGGEVNRTEDEAKNRGAGCFAIVKVEWEETE